MKKPAKKVQAKKPARVSRKPRPSELKAKAAKAASEVARAKAVVKALRKKATTVPVGDRHGEIEAIKATAVPIQALAAPVITTPVLVNPKPGQPNNGLVKTMRRSAQRNGKVAQGMKVHGGNIQITITLTELQHDAVKGMAMTNHLSMSEQIRQLIKTQIL